MKMDERYLHSLDSVSLYEIVKEEYRSYQIYTLMDRAIPYLQDGLKPGQRRTFCLQDRRSTTKATRAVGICQCQRRWVLHTIPSTRNF